MSVRELPKRKGTNYQRAMQGQQDRKEHDHRKEIGKEKETFAQRQECLKIYDERKQKMDKQIDDMTKDIARKEDHDQARKSTKPWVYHIGK